MFLPAISDVIFLCLQARIPLLMRVSAVWHRNGRFLIEYAANTPIRLSAMF